MTREEAITTNNAAVLEANETIRGLVADYEAARAACFEAYEAAANARHAALAAVEETYHSYNPDADVEEIGQDADFLKPVQIPTFDRGFFHDMTSEEFEAVVWDNQARCWTVQAPAN